MSKLAPRFSFPNTPDQVATAVRDLLIAYNLTPLFELVEFACSGIYPIPVRLVTVKAPLVLVANARQVSNTTGGISALVTNWTRSNVAGEPGVQINALDGLVARTEYIVSLLVVGQ